MNSNYDALAGGVSAWGLGKLGTRGGMGSLGALGTAQVPSWVVNRANPPDIFFDFTNNRAWKKVGGIITASSLLTVVRSTVSVTDLTYDLAAGASYSTYATNVARLRSGTGLLLFAGSTNLLLNSTAPVTQTTASLGTGAYTLWVNGSGSATPTAGSATITGATAASNGLPGGFTVSVAGTVTITVTGSLNAFQLEAGILATPLVVTAGATASQAVDSVVWTGAGPFGSAYSMYLKATPFAPTTYGVNQYALQIDDASGADNQRTLFRRNSAAGTLLVGSVGGSSGQPTPTGTWSQLVTQKLMGAFAAGDQAACFNGGTVATTSGASLPTTPTKVEFGANGGTGGPFNGILAEAAFWYSQRVPNAQLITSTT